MNFSEILSPLTGAGIGTALLCGFIIGFERQLSGKPVGIRTCCLICLGTYTFVSAGHAIPGIEADLARIIGQTITGIGFLGAGVILTREGLVIGVTSAAVIWVLAGIGILVSLGKHSAALLLSLIVIVILRGVTQLERLFKVLGGGIYSKLTRHRSDKEKSRL